MGIRITIEVDTAEQLDFVLSNWKTEKGKVITKTASRIVTSPKEPQGLKNLFELISQHPKQLAILKTLYENQQGLSDDELVEKLSLHTGNALGGTLSGLTWQAKKLGLHGKDVIDKEERDNTSGESFYFYKLTPQMVEIMKQAES